MNRKELIEYRTANSKRFLKKDGTIEVELYDYNIHYLENNKYKEINNSLKATETGYANSDNNFKVAFNESSSNELINISLDNCNLSLAIKDKHNITSTKKKLNKIKNTNILKDDIYYKNVYDNIDIKYEVNSKQLKESIILNEIPKIDNIKFTIKTDLELKLNKNNTISCKSKRKNKFTIDKPYMFDSNKEISQNVIYNLEKTTDGYEITITPDKEWLNDSKRVYPVIIDPTITGIEKDKSVIDTYIYSGDSNDTVYNTDILKVGVDKVNNKNVAYRSLLKFELPEIPASYTMINASLNLIGYPDEGYDMFNSNTLVTVHRITQEWSETNAKWDKMNNKYDSNIESYFLSTRSGLNGNTVEPKYSYADITGLVQKWYNNEPNYGLMLKAFEETYNSNVKCGYYFSKDNNVTGDSPKPRLIITYKNFNGLENYMSYTSHGHELGSSHVNNFNGNLTSIFNVANTIGGPLPVNLYLVYNTTDVVDTNKTNYGYGLGIKPNLIQIITEDKIENQELLKYLDEDGTIHYFYKDNNIYKDEDGLGLTIELNNNNYIMKDKNSNTNKFIKHSDGKYYLEEIKDTNNKTIKINYDSNNKITKVIDASNKEINITYTNNKISFISPYKTTIVNLTDNKITSIENLGDTTSIYYNSYNLIEKITNSNGLSTKYEYLNDLTYKVSKITEYSNEGNEGNYLEFTYNVKSTTIKDRKGHINTYVFNNRGNVETISNLDKNNDLSNVYGQINTYGQEDSSSVNKLILSSSMVKPIINLINHSSLEPSIEGTTMFFESDNYDKISCESDNDAHYGTSNEKIISKVNGSEVYKNISVKKGSYYTFSLYLKNDIPLELSLSYDNKKETININDINSEYNRYSISINYESNALEDLRITLKALGIGTIKVDDLQLEKGKVANLFNLISNGDFSKGTNEYEISSYKREGTQWNYESIDITPNIEVINIENNINALKIKNSPLLQTSLDKHINIAGKAGDVYELSFWYKNESIEIMPDGETTFEPCFTYTNLSFDYGEEEPDSNEPPYLKPLNNDWHYFSQKFVAKKDYNSLSFNLFDMFTINNLYITNICLFKDLESYSYVYDDEGNLVSVVDLSKETSKFAYNSNNQLIQATTPKGANYKYEYDDNVTDRLIRAISPTGITNSIDYDENNNPIKSVINNTQAFDEIVDTIYYIRARGTDDYLFINADKTLKVKQCECSHDKFNVLLQPNNRIKLQYSIMPNYYLKDNNGALKVEYGDNNNVFELIKHSNKSYSIKSVTSSLAITVNNDKSLSLTTYDESNSNQQFLFERMESSLFIESSAKYTEDGRFIKSVKDSIGNVTTYDVNNVNGLINSITDSNGNTTNYTYDNKFRVTKISNDNCIVDYEYDTNNNLSKIKHGTKDYIFNYDEFNNTSSVKINDTTLVNNIFEENNGNLNKIKYGNGQEISYEYDEFDRISSIIKSNNKYTNYYDNLGRISRLTSNEDIYKYEYDLANRLSKFKYNNFETSYDYDKDNVISKKVEKLGINKYIYNYAYNDESALTKLNILNSDFNYVYDKLGRITESNINDVYKTKYSYITNGNKTSTVIESVNDNGIIYSYTYDKLGNITEVYKDNVLINQYYYDNHSELIKESDLINNLTREFTYDNYGNILSKKIYTYNTTNLVKEDKYEYTNSNWQDLLTKFNNETITYDEIGNPTSIGNVALNWMNGRELASYSDGTNTITYKYNLDGIRTSKVVNGINTTYYLEGRTIIFEDRNGDVLYYIYNGSELLGFVYKNKTYYYHKNMFGDIIGILDSSYNEIVTYEYDSWGALVNITDSSNINLGTINPFRYRSYYYDEESGFYYLNSRYYNPKMGRFINADSMITGQGFNGNNLFVYCNNLPINKKDSSGNFVLEALIIGAVTSGISQIICNVLSGEQLSDNLMESIIIGSCAGIVGGAILWTIAPAVEIGLISQVSANIISGLGSSFMSTHLNYASGNLTKSEAIMDFTFSAFLSSTASIGINDSSLDFIQSSINGVTVDRGTNAFRQIKKEVKPKNNSNDSKIINSNIIGPPIPADYDSNKYKIKNSPFYVKKANFNQPVLPLIIPFNSTRKVCPI